MTILMICMFSLTIYKAKDKGDINKIIDMVDQTEENYISVKDTKNCDHEDMYELGFYQSDKCVFNFTVISENAIRVNGKRFKLNEKIDLSIIDGIIKKMEKQNVE